jgi:rRNA maturation protein Nop10
MDRKKCPLCKKGELRPHDYGFMIREVCSVCGYPQDTPNPARLEEYNEWKQAHVSQELKELEGDST